MSSDAFGFTVLTTFGPLATKRFSLDPTSGAIVTDPWDDARHFEARSITFTGSIDDLYSRLSALGREPRSLIIRGALRPGVDPSRVRRLLHPDLKEDEAQEPSPAFFEPCPRAWMMVDCDVAPIPAGLDVVARPDEAVDFIVERLPAEFQETDCIVLWSASAGIKPKLAAHLVFLLDRPVPDEDLRRLARTVNAAREMTIIDPALFNPVQPHYIACPVFEDRLVDPLEGRRSFIRRGLRRTVELVLPDRPPAHENRATGSIVAPASLQSIGGPEGFHGPIVRFVGAYVREAGSRGTDVDALVEMIRARVLDADPGGRDSRTINRYASTTELTRLVHWTMERDREPKPHRSFDIGPYEIQDGRFTRKKVTQNSIETIVLSNFIGKIDHELTLDDGAEQRHVFTISGSLDDGTALPPIRVAAGTFDSMNWISAGWGSRPYCVAGLSAKDHVRVAIKKLSGNPPRRIVYQHTGWRNLSDGTLAYLHAGGALTKTGNRTDIEVQAEGGIADVNLPPPAEPEEVAHAVQLILALGPAGRIILGAIGRAVLAHVLPVDSTLYLFGPTGVFKSELAAIAQSAFGAAYTARNLPASWSATPNALERLTFAAKDAVLVIDDFAPNGSTGDIAALHGKAERLLRSVGNRSGRGRLNPDGTPKPVYYPRGLVVVTGEEVPHGHSLRARSVVVEVRPGDVNPSALTKAQAGARDGLFASMTAAFIRFLAAGLEHYRSSGRARLEALRAEFAANHRRTPDAVASFRYGLETFADFAADYGVALPDDLLDLGPWHALVASQASHLNSADPVARFTQLLSALFSSGRAHCVDAATGQEPRDAGSYGWVRVSLGEPGHAQSRPQGRAIGWVSDDELLLEPDALYAELSELARKQDDPLPLTKTTFYRRLAERGVIQPDKEHSTRVRRGLGGSPGRRRVLVLPAPVLSPDRVFSETGDIGDSGDDELEGSSRESDTRAAAVTGPPGRHRAEPETPLGISDSTLANAGLAGPVTTPRPVTALRSVTPAMDATIYTLGIYDSQSPVSPMSPVLDTNTGLASSTLTPSLPDGYEEVRL